MVVLEKVVEVALSLLITLIAISLLLFRDWGSLLRALVLMLCAIIALSAPENGVTGCWVTRARLTREHSLAQLDQADLALTALHVGLGDKFIAVLRGTLTQRNLQLFKLMGVRRVCLVAFEAEGEVFALGAVEPIHLLRDGIHALVAAKPEVVPIVNQLVLSCLVRFLTHFLANLILVISLDLLFIFAVVVSIWVHLVLLVLKQLQVDGLVAFDLVFIPVAHIIIILIVE